MADFLPLGFSEPALQQRVVPDLGTGPGPVEYEHGWQVQRRVHADVASGARPNTVLLLEHEPVYTAGRLTKDPERPFDGTRVIDVDRGGKITWHGPHQLVGYPILRLIRPIDVVRYVRELEQMVIRVLRDEFDLHPTTVEGRSGVWFPGNAAAASVQGLSDRKVCAIGVRVSKTITMHGFALNCANDLSWADNIIPCGISDAGVTSISRELGEHVDVSRVLDPVIRELGPLIEACAIPAELDRPLSAAGGLPPAIPLPAPATKGTAS